MMGNEEPLACSRWAEVDSDALAADSVTVVLQINGKLREQYSVPPGLGRDELSDLVMSYEATARRIEGKEIVKIIAVPDKLVNIVVKV